MSLAELHDGQTALLEGYEPGLPAPWRRRFEDLGLLPDTPVRRVRRAPLGDPIAFEVRGTFFCLRRAQARLVRVRLGRRAPGRSSQSPARGCRGA